jgi:hypothetical protein
MKAVRGGWLPPATRRDELRLCRCDAIQGDLAAAAFGIARGRCMYTPGPWSDVSIVVNSRKRCLEQVGRPQRRWQGEEFRDSSFSSKRRRARVGGDAGHIVRVSPKPFAPGARV